MVGFGRSCPNGSLPVFSVDTEAEAKQLLIMACPRNRAGSQDFFAPELAEEQTLENLRKFSDRLQLAWDFIKMKERS